MTIGAPKMEVMALMGKLYSLPGSWAIVSQRSSSIPPTRAAAGNKIQWFEVVNSNFDRCGTAKPTKAMGPANAVMTPVRRLVHMSTRYRVFFMSTPMLIA